MPTEAVPQDPERSAELLRLAQAGNDEARNDLLARHLPRLERWASRRLPQGVRTMLDTGDLVQDAMVNALRHLGAIEIRTEKSFEVYLKRSITNRIIDLYRRPPRPRRELDEALPSNDASALDVVLGREARERYEDALDTLSESDCQLIVMHTELGMANADIADELGKSHDAVRVALGRALKRLAVAMA